MSNAPPWYAQQGPQQAPQPQGIMAWGKTVTAIITALVALVGGLGWKVYQAPSAVPVLQPPGDSGGGATAPKKPCGKCGSPDCGCQAAKVGQLERQAAELQAAIDAARRPPSVDASVIEGMQKALRDMQEQLKVAKGGTTTDPFDPTNEQARRKTTYFQVGGGSETVVEEPGKKDRRVAYTADSRGLWWIKADPWEDDQRPYFSDDKGKSWWHAPKPELAGLAPRTCKCPAEGNKDGSEGPNGCLCHQMDLTCDCHKGAGTVFKAAPPPNPTPTPSAASRGTIQPPMKMAPAPMMKPMKAAPFFAGSRQAATCST